MVRPPKAQHIKDYILYDITAVRVQSPCLAEDAKQERCRSQASQNHRNHSGLGHDRESPQVPENDRDQSTQTKTEWLTSSLV